MDTMSFRLTLSDWWLVGGTEATCPDLSGSSAGLSLSYNALNQTASITPPGGSAIDTRGCAVVIRNRSAPGSHPIWSAVWR
ncbi:hypothetical protein NITHO_4570005 [Nitrolancea hollandica Lb]|uniref:Uncharacterized protein n=1 Tax=Nitrolancea hollandica Lb TaxID=1129897 RepID=I4EKE1_9BACT|nr:hypothetical protein NITHO_4570005 [Nitrolancea hollandica Lb]